MPLKHLAHYAKLSFRMLICPLPPKGGISSLCVASAALWRRVLDFFEKALKKAEHLPPSLYPHHLRDYLTQQWEEHISSRMMREQWGDEETMTTKLKRRRLEWLGHLVRMTPERIPKITQFSWLPQTRPQGDPRRRWRDLVKSDLKAIGIQERGWYEEAQHRKQWNVTCNEEVSRHQHDQQRRREMAPCDVKCSVCGR